MKNPESNRQGIAIVGMAGRFPKAKNIEQFWNNLRQGVEAISFFTDKDLEAEGINFPKDNVNYVKARGILEEPDSLAAAFLGSMPKDAATMDRRLRFILGC